MEQAGNNQPTTEQESMDIMLCICSSLPQNSIFKYSYYYLSLSLNLLIKSVFVANKSIAK
jgi:hypothetical protein